jgi:WD40 repeat protein
MIGDKKMISSIKMFVLLCFLFIHPYYAQTLIKTLPHNDKVWAVKFSPDMKYLASACNDSIVRIWDVNNWKAIDSIVGYSSSIDFSPDGKFIATQRKTLLRNRYFQYRYRKTSPGFILFD